MNNCLKISCANNYPSQLCTEFTATSEILSNDSCYYFSLANSTSSGVVLNLTRTIFNNYSQEPIIATFYYKSSLKSTNLQYVYGYASDNSCTNISKASLCFNKYGLVRDANCKLIIVYFKKARKSALAYLLAFLFI